MVTYSLINELLLRHIEQGYSDRVVLIDKNKKYTYKELLDRVQSCANTNYFLKYSQGTIVSCLLPDSIETIIIFLALIYRGLVPCILNVNLVLDNYSEYINNANCSCIIATASLLPSLIHKTKHLGIDYINCDELFSTKLNISQLKQLKQLKVIVNEIAFCLYTSGTTGSPALVLHRHQDPIIMNKNYGQIILGLCENDIIFTTSRLYFAYGLNTLFFALLNKAKLIIPPKEFLTPELIYQQVVVHKPSVFFSVPTIYKRLLKVIPKNFGIHFFRLCISAGENLPLSVFNAWKQQTSFSILDGIGTTEVLSTFISNRPNNFKPGSTGYPVPGFKVKLLNVETNQLTNPGDIGVLMVKGETYVTCYSNNQVESKRRFIDGWFKTNDLFSIDLEGFYFYHGRVNDLIKVSGIWVYPYRIEQVLVTHPAVNEVIVIGRQETDGLLRLFGFIVLSENYIPSEQLTTELKDWCKKRGAKHEYPHFVCYVDMIPKTSSGKSKRFLLAQQNIKDLEHVD